MLALSEDCFQHHIGGIEAGIERAHGAGNEYVAKMLEGKRDVLLKLRQSCMFTLPQQPSELTKEG